MVAFSQWAPRNARRRLILLAPSGRIVATKAWHGIAVCYGRRRAPTIRTSLPLQVRFYRCFRCARVVFLQRPLAPMKCRSSGPRGSLIPFVGCRKLFIAVCCLDQSVSERVKAARGTLLLARVPSTQRITTSRPRRTRRPLGGTRKEGRHPHPRRRQAPRSLVKTATRGTSFMPARKI